MYIPGQSTASESSDAKCPLGFNFKDSDGKTWYYVRANEALAAGDILTPMIALASGDCDASSGSTLLDAAVGFSAMSSYALPGAYLKINVGTLAINDAPIEIKEIAATKLTLVTTLSTAVTTSEDYVVYNPWLVEKCDAAGEMIVGVAPIAVTAGYYFFMQTGGYCSAVNVIGGTDAIAANEGLISSSTAGTAKGLTAAGTTADEADKSNIRALFPSALTQKIPALLNCLP